LICVCTTAVELTGDAAEAYVREHLERLELDPEDWSVRFRCPETGRRWVRDFPTGRPHSGGPPRLRRLDQDGHPVDEAGGDAAR